MVQGTYYNIIILQQDLSNAHKVITVAFKLKYLT